MKRDDEMSEEGRKFLLKGHYKNSGERLVAFVDFCDGWRRADETMVEKAYRWLEENMNTSYFMYSEKYVILNDFKKAMLE